MSGGKVDLNTDPESDAKIEFSQFNATEQGNATARYQIELLEDGYYDVSLRLNLSQGQEAAFSVMTNDEIVGENTYVAPIDGWQTCKVRVRLDNGLHTLEIVNSSSDPCGFNWLQLDYQGTSGVDKMTGEAQPVSVEYYNLQGQRTQAPQPGICIVVTNMSDGNQQVSKQVTP